MRSLRVPVEIFPSRHYGFAQVAIVATPSGDAVHVSGQVAWDADRKIVGAGDIGRQLEKSLENLAIVSHRLGRNSIRSVRYDFTSGKAIYTKARPSVARSRRCSATIRRVQLGSGCQASPTTSSSSRWNPLSFFSRESSPRTPLPPAQQTGYVRHFAPALPVFAGRRDDRLAAPFVRQRAWHLTNDIAIKPRRDLSRFCTAGTRDAVGAIVDSVNGASSPYVAGNMWLGTP